MGLDEHSMVLHCVWAGGSAAVAQVSGTHSCRQQCREWDQALASVYGKGGWDEALDPSTTSQEHMRLEVCCLTVSIARYRLKEECPLMSPVSPQLGNKRQVGFSADHAGTDFQQRLLRVLPQD